MSDRRLRIGLLCEQLLQPAPGGIGVYVRALLDTLPTIGVELLPLTAWQRRRLLDGSGLGGARRLPLPRRLLYEAWSRWGRPRIDCDVDLIHAPSLAFPTRGRLPLIVTVHDVLFLRYPELYPPHGLAFHRRSLARLGTADLVICPSQATMDAVGSIDEPPERFAVVPLGTDMSAPAEAEATLKKLGLQGPYVLWVGTLEPRKNLTGVIGGFVRAASILPKGNNLNLYLVGPQGWGGRNGVESVDGVRIPGPMRHRIRWLGIRSRAELASLYARAAAFVFPSFDEGFGLPVLEAMACGTPVVTSDRPGIREVAGDAALLCDPTDAEAIGANLSAVLSDPDLANERRRRGLERAAEFTWERTARETLSCYQEVAGMGRP